MAARHARRIGGEIRQRDAEQVRKCKAVLEADLIMSPEDISRAIAESQKKTRERVSEYEAIADKFDGVSDDKWIEVLITISKPNIITKTYTC